MTSAGGKGSISSTQSSRTATFSRPSSVRQSPDGPLAKISTSPETNTAQSASTPAAPVDAAWQVGKADTSSRSQRRQEADDFSNCDGRNVGGPFYKPSSHQTCSKGRDKSQTDEAVPRAGSGGDGGCRDGGEGFGRGCAELFHPTGSHARVTPAHLWSQAVLPASSLGAAPGTLPLLEAAPSAALLVQAHILHPVMASSSRHPHLRRMIPILPTVLQQLHLTQDAPKSVSPPALRVTPPSPESLNIGLGPVGSAAASSVLWCSLRST